MRQKVIAGNWKMHKTISEGLKLVEQLQTKLAKNPPTQTRIIICPPFTSLTAIRDALQDRNIELGAQNIAWEEEGAYTGEISAKMVKSAGARYTIIGHSERRTYFKEDASTINKKIKVALKNKLKVIHCIGESLEEREQNLTKEIIVNQLEWDLKDLDSADLKNIIIAYEPVWAIGTGKTATPEQAQEVHQFIREILDAIFKDGIGKKMTVLYGGSVKPINAKDLLAQPDLDGALVGGACLKANDFLQIIQASEKSE